jgi:hypothetical protein
MISSGERGCSNALGAPISRLMMRASDTIPREIGLWMFLGDHIGDLGTVLTPMLLHVR